MIHHLYNNTPLLLIGIFILYSSSLLHTLRAFSFPFAGC
ncbi:hypothetical protein EC07798_0832 [Escherichia coli 07798]|nr:hypothetical protein EC07798_0832 [Escherichia coli 07798]KDZ49391.1 putative membrane protein [Escherichia coli 3-073-06_S1_C1]